jgi:hypothetical protein
MPEVGTDLRRVISTSKRPGKEIVSPQRQKSSSRGYHRGSASGHIAVRKATWWPPVADLRAATGRSAGGDFHDGQIISRNPETALGIKGDCAQKAVIEIRFFGWFYKIYVGGLIHAIAGKPSADSVLSLFLAVGEVSRLCPVGSAPPLPWGKAMINHLNRKYLVLLSTIVIR